MHHTLEAAKPARQPTFIEVDISELRRQRDQAMMSLHTLRARLGDYNARFCQSSGITRIS